MSAALTRPDSLAGKLRSARRRKRQPRFKVTADTTLTELFQHGHLPAKLRRSTVAYCYRFQTAIAAFNKFMGGEIPVERIVESHLDEFEGAIRTGLAPVTAANYRRHIATLLRFAFPGRFPRRPAGPRRKTLPPPAEGSLRWLLQDYRRKRLLGAADVTIEQYEVAIQRLRQQHGRDVMAADLSDDLLLTHMAWLLDSGRARGTANNARLRITTLWRHARRLKLVATLPDVPKLREDLDAPEAWSAEQISRLLTACGQLKGREGRLPARHYWTALILTCLNTGLRRRSLFELHRDDLDLSESVLTARGAIMKNRRGQRFLLLPQTVEAIRRIWLPGRVALFPWKASRRLQHKRLGRLLRAANLPDGRRDKFHKLRRTCATIIAESATMAHAQDYLGHASMRTTSRYVDTSNFGPNDMREHLGAFLDAAAKGDTETSRAV